MFICEKEFDCVDCPKVNQYEKCEHWIEVKKIIRAEWEKTEYNGFLRCSNCKDCYVLDEWMQDNRKWDYCPACGANMRYNSGK